MIHVMPVDDLRPHTCSTTCWCKPRVDFDDGEGVAVHNSADGREFYEQMDDFISEVEKGAG